MLLAAAPPEARPLHADLAGARAGHDRGQRGAGEAAVAIEGDRAGGDQAVGAVGRLPELARIAIELGVPAVGRGIAHEGEREVVRPAEAVEDLDLAAELGLRARGAAGLGVGREVTRGVGRDRRRLVGIEIGADPHLGRRHGDAVDVPHVDRLDAVRVDRVPARVQEPALEIVTGRGAEVAQRVRREGSRPRIELLARGVGRGVDDEEAGAGDGGVGR